MSEKEDQFFDRLEAHIELLKSDPTAINQASMDFIFSFIRLTKGQAEELIALKESKDRQIKTLENRLEEMGAEANQKIRQVMNREGAPVAWRYKYDHEDTCWNFKDDENLIKSMIRVSKIIAEPLFLASQTHQTPIGKMCIGCGSSWSDERLSNEKAKNPNLVSCCPDRKMVDVYTTPQTKPLSDEEKIKLYQTWLITSNNPLDLFRAIEAKVRGQ